jgi:hypothetical protein
VTDYLTRGDILTQVQDFIDDDSSTMATILNRFINNAYRKVWRCDQAHGPLWTISGPHSFTVTAGTSTYNLSASNPGEIVAATFEGYPEPMRRVTDAQLIDMHQELVQDGNSTPYIYRFRRRFATTGSSSIYMDLFPTPDSNAAGNRVFYLQTAPWAELATSTQVPVMPPDFHDILVWGAAYQAAAYDGADAKAGMFKREWEEGMKRLREYNWSLIADTTTIQPRLAFNMVSKQRGI